MTLVNAETGEVVDVLSVERARKLTDRIATKAEEVWVLVREAYEGRAWLALGHANWDAYWDAEFGDLHIRLPREERQEVVGSLRSAGLSIRAIAQATGAAVNTVRSDLGQVYQPDTPDADDLPDRPTDHVEPILKGQPAPKPKGPKPIIGRDGKNYPAPAPKPDRQATNEGIANDVDVQQAKVRLASSDARLRIRKAMAQIDPEDAAAVADEYAIEDWQRLRGELDRFFNKFGEARPRGLHVVKGA